MSKVLIIDDSDPEIIYTGSWTKQAVVSTNSKEYNSTVHRSGAPGDKLSYTFHGSVIAVYGTIEDPASYGAPSASFSVDGGASTAFNSTGSVLVTNPTDFSSHILLYRSSVLPVDSHTLTIEIGTLNNDAAHLYVDFLTISTDSNNVSGDVIYDERDPLVTYTGIWKESGGADEYMHTTMRAPDTGGSATFHFNGSSISVYGTTSANTTADNTANISFALDGVSSGTWTGSQDLPVIRHNLFFHKDGLSDTQEHSIVMTTSSRRGWYLDYFIVHSTVTTTVSSTSSAGSTNSGTGDSSANGAPNVGLIAGAAAGCVIGVIILAGIIFVLMRRRRSRQDEQMKYPDEKSQANQIPGTSNASTPPALVSTYAEAGPSTYSGPPLLDTTPTDSLSPPRNERFINEKSRMNQAQNTPGTTQVVSLPSQSHRTSQSDISGGSPAQTVEPPRRAIDGGGVRLQSADDDDGDDETLPPSYAQY